MTALPAMPPGRRRTTLVRELARTRRFLLSSEWLSWVIGQPGDTRLRAAAVLMRIELARLALLDAELAAIGDTLAAHESELAAAVAALTIARDDPAQVDQALDFVANLLEAVARIVAVTRVP